ncbi:MAG: DUF4445 domain-containing protein [Sedimentisphaerales bacterium]|nr:DUF4445 domain-containing protein [Sedimentisphaerales bacterium]
MKHFTITFEPDGKQIAIHAGATVVEAAGQAGIVLNTACGGRGTCKKCLVKILPEDKEVLACQYRIQSNLIVSIPSQSRYFQQQILEQGIEAKIEPGSNIYEELRLKATSENIFGVAIDIGTTTVVAKLMNMVDGRSQAVESDLNPQTKYGDDVISRISYAQDLENLADLNKVIIDCINKLIDKLCRKTSIFADEIYEVCVVGNTTMNHIFLQFPIAQLGWAPYKAHSLDAYDSSAEKLYIKINPQGNIHTVENIAGFVGSDTTAVALATGIDSAEKKTLIVDIGTNGEIVLGSKDKLYAASCAAGPALEGARISCGSRAVEGAIEAVVIGQDDIDLDVIGNCTPHSICGSGLIDAAAVLLDLGIIDTTGRFAEPDRLKDVLPTAIVSRIMKLDGQLGFTLYRNINENQYGVIITQRDIRQIQLAKAAIRAGIKILMRKLDIADADIEQIFLAGAFGNYIRPESALRIGLLPTGDTQRLHFIGNAALSGAEMILLSRQRRDHALKLARMIEYVEIANESDFQDIYADCMNF